MKDTYSFLPLLCLIVAAVFLFLGGFAIVDTLRSLGPYPVGLAGQLFIAGSLAMLASAVAARRKAGP